jgi:hypothetical protein
MKTKKLLLAAAVTGLVAGGATFSNTVQAAEKGKGHCHGVNTCKGTGACGGATHGCAGKNACKGKGWVYKTKNECNEAILKAAAKNGMKFTKK